MQAVRALEKLPGADACVKFDEFVRSLKSGNLAEKYKAVCGEDESRTAEGA